jgi:hypothetical protein
MQQLEKHATFEMNARTGEIAQRRMQIEMGRRVVVKPTRKCSVIARWCSAIGDQVDAARLLFPRRPSHSVRALIELMHTYAKALGRIGDIFVRGHRDAVVEGGLAHVARVKIRVRDKGVNTGKFSPHIRDGASECQVLGTARHHEQHITSRTLDRRKARPLSATHPAPKGIWMCGRGQQRGIEIAGCQLSKFVYRCPTRVRCAQTGTQDRHFHVEAPSRAIDTQKRLILGSAASSLGLTPEEFTVPP